MDVSMTVIDIQNIVASSSLGTELDLFKILDSFETAQYDPKQFPGLIYRISEPKTATLLFKSGKLVCTGGKSREDVERAAGETFVASDERAAELLANLPAGYVEIEKPRRRTRKAKEQ